MTAGETSERGTSGAVSPSASTRLFTEGFAQSLLPVLRIASQVHDAANQYAVVTDLVDNAIRKPVCHAAPCALGERGHAFGKERIRTNAFWTSAANS